MLLYVYPAAMVAGACGLFDAEEHLVVGRIEHPSLPPQEVLGAPDTVSAGVPFDVTIATMGGGCIRHSASSRRTAPSPLLRVFLPLDVRVDRGGVCPADLIPLRRTERVRFDQPGDAVLRVQGRRDSGVDGGNGFATVERRIVVR